MFHVIVNGVTVIADLDIYARVGKAVAHDEVITFTVQDQQLSVANEIVNFDGTVIIQFAKASKQPHHIVYYVV